MYLLYPPSTHLCEVQVRFVSIKHLCPKKATGHLPVMVILIKQWDEICREVLLFQLPTLQSTLEIPWRSSFVCPWLHCQQILELLVIQVPFFLFWRGMV